MNPRLVAVLLLGFVTTLAFLAWLIAGRRKGQRERLERLIDRNRNLEDLVGEILVIAQQSRDIDPSAELILITINNHTRSKEIA